MKKLISLLIVSVFLFTVAYLQLATANSFTYSLVWDGQGSDSLDCDKLGESPERTADGWMHWIVTQASGITGAELVLGGSGSGEYEPTKYGPTIEFFTPYFDVATLTATFNYAGSLGNNSQFTLSDYCPGVGEEDLTVTKTALTYWEREHFWDIDKSVETENEEFINGTPKIWLYPDGSGNENATWTVDVTYEGYEDSDHNVSGVITIVNTGDLDAVITDVDDVLAGETIDVDCDVTFPYVLEVGETLTCDYDEDGYVEGYNEVTVTTERDTYFADAEIVWGDPDEDINAFVEITDTNQGFADEYGEVILDAYEYDLGDIESFFYSKDFAWENYGQDNCGSYQYNNTAVIVETEQSASAMLKVNVLCEILEVTKTANTSYIRTHNWNIYKWVETDNEHKINGTPKIWLYTDGSGNEAATWYVDVTYLGYEDSDHNVSGVITIVNTGDLDAVITAVDDVLAGETIDVDCDVEFPYTLEVEETLTCTYSEDIEECPHKYVLNITSVNNNTGFTHVFTINYDPITDTVNGSGDSPHAGTQTLSEFDYNLTDGVISYIKFRSDYDATSYYWFPAFYLNEDGTLTYDNIGGDNVSNAEGTWTKEVNCKIEGFNEVTVTTERDTYFADAEIVWRDPDEDINASVEITDTNQGFADKYGEVILDAYEYDLGDIESFFYSKDFAWENYGQDNCGSHQYDNTAVIVETEQSASAMLKVNVQCYIYDYDTAYAKGDDAICFIPIFSNWGWTNPITPDTYEMDLWAGAAQCDTSKGALVGSVTVVYGDDGHVSATYNVDSPNYLKEKHFYAGTTTFPQVKRGKKTISTIAPGQYYNAGPFDGSEVYVIAHAVVGIGTPDPGFGPEPEGNNLTLFSTEDGRETNNLPVNNSSRNSKPTVR